MIKDSTRVFAWVCIVLTGLMVGLGCAEFFAKGSGLAELALSTAMLVGWIALLVRPQVGWWLLVLLYVGQIGILRWEIDYEGYRLFMASGLLVMAYAGSAAVLAVPLLVLACDSPWRWRTSRQVDGVAQVASAYTVRVNRSAIKLCTRVVAWLCILLIGMQVMGIRFLWGYDGSHIPEQVFFVLLIWGWVALLLVPVVGWWSLVPLYVFQIVFVMPFVLIQKATFYFPPGAVICTAVFAFITATVPLLVLAFDSPWRWKKLQQTAGVA